MKKLASYAIILIAILFTSVKTSAQSANRSLSNLVTTTKINVDLLPDSTNAYDLGSKKKSWKNIYAKGAYYLNGDKFISNSGYYNTFIGSNTGQSNTNGSQNTSTGYEALYFNSTGYWNSAFGEAALFSNISGGVNTAVGTDALGNNISGYGNTASGGEALALNNDSYNTAFGAFSLRHTIESEYNTAVGYNAGYTYDNGWNNVFLGANTDVNGAGYYNVIAIGQDVTCTASSQARIGNAATNSIGGYANWTNISDGRVKRNIKQNVPGLQFINKLQPITYNLDLTAADNIIQAQRKDSAGKIIPLSSIETKARKAKEQIIYTGFVAQDVEKAAKSLNYDFSGVDAAKNNKDLYGLRYAEFVVPLVKAMQELSKMNDEKDSAIQNLQNQINELKTMINSNPLTVSRQLSTSLSSASLQQNVPNPFQSSTTINYTLPQQYLSAKIIITDNKGVVLKKLNLNAKGKGSVKVDASTLASGAYQYSLYVNGTLIDTKPMISSK